jgi:hypothetical protein
MASNFYRKGDSPRYFLGHGLEIGFITMGIAAAVVLLLGYRKLNRKRDAQLDNGEDMNFTVAELSSLGDKAMTFRYMY